MFEIRTTEIFDDWYARIKDSRARDKITARMYRASEGNFGDWKTESGEVRAMRVDYGPGYRLYYVIRGAVVVFMLCGGDKGGQSADIKRAIELAREV
jgi:putative addiction module killer protein